MKAKAKEIIADVTKLFRLAKANVKTNLSRTKRYIYLARKISMRTRVPIPNQFKRSFCKKCFVYWIPNYNVKISVNCKQKLAEYKCGCGAVKKFGLKPKKDR